MDEIVDDTVWLYEPAVRAEQPAQTSESFIVGLHKSTSTLLTSLVRDMAGAIERFTAACGYLAYACGFPGDP